MLRALYDWVMRLAEHKHAETGLFGIAFAESSFFPLPPDLMIIPMVLADRMKAWRIAIIATVGSVLGGILGYYIGAFLYDLVGQPIIEFYGLTHKMDQVFANYQLYGALIVFVAGFSPIPYKVFTIASGVVGMYLPSFIAASLVGRGARFLLVAGLLYWFGPTIRTFVERYLGILTFAFAVLLIAGFVAIKYIFV